MGLDKKLELWYNETMKRTQPMEKRAYVLSAEELEEIVSSSYSKGYGVGLEDGVDEGYSDGYGDGYEIGGDEGYEAGLEDGYDEGSCNGYIEAWAEAIFPFPEEDYEEDYEEEYEEEYEVTLSDLAIFPNEFSIIFM